MRFPFNYRLLSPEEQPGVYLEEGFQIIDQLLEWCETRQLYLILDMHCAPGGQSKDNISDSDGIEARLWTDDTNKTRTVDMWRTIAERYAEEEWIGGYDLINEPVLPDGYSNADLMALYQDIVEAVREVDTNHMVFIEGNWYATNFDLLTPPFDSNMAYSFHKYWSDVSQSSIQSYVNIRNQHSVPLWMGESGENSNPWFFDFVQLLEENDIGWNWWTHKKIETLTSPYSSPISPSYQTLINFWNGQGDKPSAAFAKSALFEMADNLLLENCEERPGVLQALTRSDFDERTIPFAEHHIPGKIECEEYDFGDAGVAYKDKVIQNIGGSSWNNGWTYRNDGVDIEVCTDSYWSNYNIGWTETGEWMAYTVQVDGSGLYDVEFRTAAPDDGGKAWLLLDGQPLTDVVSIPATGGGQNWTLVSSPAGPISAGEHTLKIMIVTGGFNINFIRFIQTEELSRGDIDGDGEVNVLDVLFVLNIILHNVDPTSSEVWLADCTGDGAVDIMDAIGIVNVILGLGTCQP